MNQGDCLSILFFLSCVVASKNDFSWALSESSTLGNRRFYSLLAGTLLRTAELVRTGRERMIAFGYPDRPPARHS